MVSCHLILLFCYIFCNYTNNNIQSLKIIGDGLDLAGFGELIGVEKRKEGGLQCLYLKIIKKWEKEDWVHHFLIQLNINISTYCWERG